MKKLGLILMSFLVIGAVYAGPAVAEEVYKVKVIKCGVPGTTGDCGFFPPSPLPLDQGDVQTDKKGRVRVALEGAGPNTTFKIYIGSFFIGGGFVQRYPDGFCCRSIGTVTTDADGQFEGPITTPLGAEFVFPLG